MILPNNASNAEMAMAAMQKADPAFPVCMDIGREEVACFGLTKREYFASAAMQTLIVTYHGTDADIIDITTKAARFAEQLINSLADTKP